MSRASTRAAVVPPVALALLLAVVACGGGGSSPCAEESCREGSETCCPGAAPGIWNPRLEICNCGVEADADDDGVLPDGEDVLPEDGATGSDADAEADAEADGGGGAGTCTSPVLLACGDTLADESTAGADSSLSVYVGCGSTREETGPERVYRLRTTTAQGVTITMTPTAGQDNDIFVLADSCLEESCLVDSVAGVGGETETVEFAAEPAADYYLVVDGLDGATGSFDITVTCGPPEDCENGVDDDADTLVDCCDPACSGATICRETCNGLDDDCDDDVDDGITCTGCTRQENGGHVYQFCTTASAWTAAQGACQGMGYRLAAVGSSAENTWIDSTAAAAAPERWWLGGIQGSAAGCAEPAGCWGWENGEAWSFVNWATGEPNEYVAGEDCLNIRYAGDDHWNDEPCTRAGPYVCEQDCFPQTYGGHAYLFCTGSLDWAAARDACSADGYHLVTVDDAAEDTWLGTTANALRSTTWWIGLSDRDVEGTWVWVSGTSSFRNWCPLQPDDHLGNQDCACLLFGCALPLNWDDSLCDNRMPYVCERP
jgi:hypothetical protein